MVLITLFQFIGLIIVFVLPGFLSSFFIFDGLKLLERLLIGYALSIPIFIILYIIDLYIISFLFESRYFSLFFLYILTIIALVYFLEDIISNAKFLCKIRNKFSSIFKTNSNNFKDNSSKDKSKNLSSNDDTLSKEEMKKVEKMTKKN